MNRLMALLRLGRSLYSLFARCRERNSYIACQRSASAIAAAGLSWSGGVIAAVGGLADEAAALAAAAAAERWVALARRTAPGSEVAGLPQIALAVGRRYLREASLD